MKIAMLVLRLLLPVLAIVLLGLSMAEVTADPQPLLILGLLCACTGLTLNTYCMHKERKDHDH